MKKSLVTAADLNVEEIRALFDLAHRVKAAPQDYRTKLQGQMFGLIFEKPSTRTWVSFEVGVFSLGGGSIYLGPEDIKLGQREEIRDIARVMSRYLSGVVLRTFAHKTITEFAKYFQKPVVNGLSDFEHPCQALSDFFTLEEKFGANAKPVIAFVGDGNNVLNSLLLLSAKLGRTIHYATPEGHEPDRKILEAAEKTAQGTGAVIRGFRDPVEAVAEADALYTDVWVSMGQESRREEKIKAFQGMQLNEELIAKAKKDAVVMHCLPAHRGEEITNEVLESGRSIVFDQAENRLHVQKALLLQLCGVS